MSKINEEKENPREQRRRGRPTLAEQLGRQRPRAGSLGSLFGITDVNKRKREGEAEQERVKAEREFLDNFRKNRKIGRSPPLKKEVETQERGRSMETHDKLDNLMEIILKIKEDMEEIKKENKILYQEMRDLKEEWIKKQETWEKEKEIMEDKIKKLESKEEHSVELAERIKEIERKEEMREQKERKNNIVAKGEEILWKETPKDTVEQILDHYFHLKSEIEDAYWIRKSSGGGILVAKLKSGQQKKEIMLRKGELKGKKLYIENDLTKKEREGQRELVKLANVEKAQGSQVKIGYRKLWVNGRFYK